MKTNHKIYFENSSNMSALANGSVDLIVTSPPYPMIEMWDEMFSLMNPEIGEALAGSDGTRAFELMNRELDPIWNETYRILKEGGFACINIGDATRTLNGHFMLYPNHARILNHMLNAGFTSLPEILWRKQSNAPNKFMGSGMMPAGAYVTQEHEYILILRKGGKRVFSSAEEKLQRRSSSFFWEERNLWFSDIWNDLKGATQKIKEKKTRERSAAYPFDLPYRLINMYSAKGDTVVDPFLGMGTTMLAAMSAGRNSVGYEIAPEFSAPIASRLDNIVEFSCDMVDKRLENHILFVKERLASGKELKHKNENYGFPVVTKQETDILLEKPANCERVNENEFEVTYAPDPVTTSPVDFAIPTPAAGEKNKTAPKQKKNTADQMQLSLF